MQVFNAFFKIAKKRMNVLIVYFLVYMIMNIMLVSSGNKTMEDAFTSKNLSVYVTDEDHSEASAALISYLETLHKVESSTLTKEQLDDRLYYRMVDYVLEIPAGFEEKLLAGDTEDLLSDYTIPGTYNGAFVSAQISEYLKSLQMQLVLGKDLTEAIKITDEKIAALPQVEMTETEGVSDSTSVFRYFQYLPYILLCMLFVGMAPIVVLMNSKELADRTLCSSFSARKRTLQISLGVVLYAILTWALYMVIAFFFFGTALFTPKALLAVLNSFVFLLFAVAVTLLISMFAPGENTVNILANTLGLGISFLCGVFVPQSMLAPSVLNVAKFLPAYWYIAANDMLAGSGSRVFDMNFYYECILMQLLFATATFAVMLCITGTRKHNYELLSMANTGVEA